MTAERTAYSLPCVFCVKNRNIAIDKAFLMQYNKSSHGKVTFRGEKG